MLPPLVITEGTITTGNLNRISEIRPGRAPGLFACAAGVENWVNALREGRVDADRID
jgi:hypothetical protein